MEDPVLFVLTVLAILGTPGPTNTLLATAGASVGLRRALRLMPSEAAGYLIAILAIGLIFRPMVTHHPTVGVVLRLLVGIYLLWLALGLWRRGGLALPGPAQVITMRQIFVTTLLNPKAIVFALGVIPFGASRPWLYLLSFLVLLSGVALAWISLGAAMGRAATALGRAALVPRVGALVVGVFALLLVASPFVRWV
jgi:threonine/homoserine/homoserine lactone efflux protein